MPEPTEFDDHLAIHAAEVAALEPTAWEVWIAEVERLLGHDADGDLGHWPQRGERTGYSLDTFHDMFATGLSPRSASVRILGAVFRGPPRRHRLPAHGRDGLTRLGRLLRAVRGADPGRLSDTAA